jgi:hypothetical protein
MLRYCGGKKRLMTLFLSSFTSAHTRAGRWWLDEVKSKVNNQFSCPTRTGQLLPLLMLIKWLKGGMHSRLLKGHKTQRRHWNWHWHFSLLLVDNDNDDDGNDSAYLEHSKMKKKKILGKLSHWSSSTWNCTHPRSFVPRLLLIVRSPRTLWQRPYCWH